MRLSSVRILGVSLGVGIAVGFLGGITWAALADRVLWHGIGTGWVIVGIIAFGIGMIGATEPPEGWATGARRRQRRRHVLKVATEEHDRLQGASSLDLFIWGLVVGGGLIGLSMLAFTWAV